MKKFVLFLALLACSSLAFSADVSEATRAKLASYTRVSSPLKGGLPDYPSELCSRKVAGFIVVGFTILPNGSVSDAYALETSDRGFEMPAIMKVMRWQCDKKLATKHAYAIFDFAIDAQTGKCSVHLRKDG